MTDLPTNSILRTATAASLAFVLATSAGWAQSTETADTADQVPAAETPAETGTDDLAAQVLSTGEEVAAPNAAPGIYIKEEHGDWEIRCLEAPEGQEDPCQMFQRLSDQNGNPTADVNIFDLPDGGEIVAGATILTPLQTLLTAQVTMQIDSGQPRRYPFAFCDVGGCYARLGLRAEDVNRLKRGAKATLTVVPAQAPDQEALLTMSLTGFTAGFSAVEVPNQN
ncbi:invasion associated locus B family protein [Jannaschia sp. M317]|uniref:invasion associated locus B family protein n=1 Tax=Jannaschia sp. M317 TaxID=2867011 RepID=UPI0021A3E792|nr:invasion associated locus B family protein [Jannaschia sp. M317]UWQ16607.1 invasion associated locus B family protein [Jannaschia sp. M317]